MTIARDTARTVVPPLLAACVVALIIGDPATGSGPITLTVPQAVAVGR